MGVGRWAAAASAAAIALVACSMLLVSLANSPAVELINLRFSHNGGAVHKQDAVRGAIQSNLDNAAKKQEGLLYAHALQRAGFKFDTRTKKAIVNGVSGSKARASSLAIDPRLQTQVAVADTIKARSAAEKGSYAKARGHTLSSMPARQAKGPGNSESDRVRLAEAILSKGQEHSVGKHAKATGKKTGGKVTTSVKQGMKNMLDQKADKDLKQLEFKGEQHTEKALTSQLAGNPMAAEMMKKLNAKASREQKELFKEDRVKALSKQDLATPVWDHSHDTETSTLSSGSKAVDLSIGSGSDGTQLNVVNNPKMSRVQLENALRNQLDGKAGSIGAQAFHAKLATLEGNDHNPQTSLRTAEAHWNAAEDDSFHAPKPKTIVAGEGWDVSPDQFVKKPMHKVEAKLRAQLNAEDYQAAEEMYHKSLVSEKFHEHTPRHISE